MFEEDSVLTLLHVPTRRLGAEVDANGERNSRDEGRTDLEAPGDLGHVLDDDIGRSTHYKMFWSSRMEGWRGKSARTLQLREGNDIRSSVKSAQISPGSS